MNYKDISEIRKAWDNGEYFSDISVPAKVREDHIFDEDLSVKRNREMVQEWNENVRAMRDKKMRENAELSRKLTDDVVAYIMGCYDMSESAARIVEGYVYTEKHSFMSDYFSAIDDLADMVSRAIEAK